MVKFIFRNVVCCYQRECFTNNLLSPIFPSHFQSLEHVISCVSGVSSEFYVQLLMEEVTFKIT